MQMADSWAETTATRVLNAVPGYRGYRDKESRRDADRAVRDRLAHDLDRLGDAIMRVAGRLADARRLSDVGQVNALATALRHERDRIATASYGYGGIMSDRSIDAAVLDQIRLFDEALFASLEAIDLAVRELQSSTADSTSLATAAGAVQARIGDLAARFDGRGQMIESATAATAVQVASALDILKPPGQQAAETVPHPAFNLQPGDALSVMDDNYVVDALIEVESAGETFRLFRVDVAPETWLVVPRQPGSPHGLLTRAAADYNAGPPPTIGADEFSVESSGNGSGETAGAGGETGRRPVTYTLLRSVTNPATRGIVLEWGEEQLTLVGRDTDPADLEVFGRPQ